MSLIAHVLLYYRNIEMKRLDSPIHFLIPLSKVIYTPYYNIYYMA